MSKINDGGPVFPWTADRADRGGIPGMSMREYFAAHCPITLEEASEIAQDLGVKIDLEPNLKNLIRWYADLRVCYADAMLAASGRSVSVSPETMPAREHLGDPDKQTGIYSQAPDPADWIEWEGGACPVLRRLGVEVKLRDGEQIIGEAMFFEWEHRDHPEHDDKDIIAYRVLP